MKQSISKIRIKSFGYFACWMVWLCAAGCSKEKTELLFSELHTGTTLDLNRILFVSDSVGYIVGGNRYEQGILLQTRDGGATWINRSSEQMIKALYGLHFPSADTGYACGYDGKIFRSLDSGVSWQLYQNPLYRAIRSVYMMDGKNGFCVGGDGYKSGYRLQTDNGSESWKYDTPLVEFREVLFLNRYEGIISGYGTIIKTQDGGSSWYPTDASQDFFVSMSFINPARGYAIGYTGSILKTTDRGETWETLRNANSLFRAQWYLNCVAFRNEHTGYIAGENGCFLKTTDGGQHWMIVENAPGGNWKGIFLTAAGGMVCGDDGKLFRFTD